MYKSLGSVSRTALSKVKINLVLKTFTVLFRSAPFMSYSDVYVILIVVDSDFMQKVFEAASVHQVNRTFFSFSK